VGCEVMGLADASQAAASGRGLGRWLAAREMDTERMVEKGLVVEENEGTVGVALQVCAVTRKGQALKDLQAMEEAPAALIAAAKGLVVEEN